MKVFITGADGFVGGYLADALLRKGFEVHGTYLARSKGVSNHANGVYWHLLDITCSKQVTALLKTIQPDQIYHLAAQSSAGLSWEKPALTLRTNVEGTGNLLEAIKKTCPQAKTLLAGSSEEYGFIKEQTPIDENHLVLPATPYAASKVAQNQLGVIYYHAYHIPIVMTRAFNHIGPRQSQSFVVPSFAKQIATIEAGHAPAVIQVGNLDVYRDFLDVRDVVQAYQLLLDCDCPGQTFNIASGSPVSINIILETLLSFSSCPIEVKPDPARMRPLDNPFICGNAAKLIKATHWSPKYTLTETLKDMLMYERIIAK